MGHHRPRCGRVAACHRGHAWRRGRGGPVRHQRLAGHAAACPGAASKRAGAGPHARPRAARAPERAVLAAHARLPLLRRRHLHLHWHHPYRTQPMARVVALLRGAARAVPRPTAGIHAAAPLRRRRLGVPGHAAGPPLPAPLCIRAMLTPPLRCPAEAGRPTPFSRCEWHECGVPPSS